MGPNAVAKDSAKGGYFTRTLFDGAPLSEREKESFGDRWTEAEYRGTAYNFQSVWMRGSFRDSIRSIVKTSREKGALWLVDTMFCFNEDDDLYYMTATKTRDEWGAVKLRQRWQRTMEDLQEYHSEEKLYRDCLKE